MTIGVLLTQKQTIMSGDAYLILWENIPWLKAGRLRHNKCVDNDGASGCNNDNLQYVQPVTTYLLRDNYRFSARVKLYRCNTYL